MSSPNDRMRGTVPSERADESPGVPGFRTWRGVYLLVFVAFVFVVIALALLARVYA
jgi:hypothetical protein